MNTKNILTVLCAIAVIIIIVVTTKTKKDDVSTEPQIDPVTGEVILGTGGPDGTTDPLSEGKTEGENPVTNEKTPNPTFPKTGF